MKKMYLIKISDELYLVKYEVFDEMIKICVELSKDCINDLKLARLVENMISKDNEENIFIDINLLDLNYLLDIIKKCNNLHLIKNLISIIKNGGGCLL